MLYPRLKKKSVHVKTVSAFRGYERRLKTSEGALYGSRLPRQGADDLVDAGKGSRRA